MRIIEPAVHVFQKLLPERLLHHIEVAGRVSYKSDSPYTAATRRAMAAKLIANRHLSVLDHPSLSVLFVFNRGISHEEVRTRVGAGYTQESTRFCDYQKDRLGGGISVINPYALVAPDHGPAGLCDCDRCKIWETWLETINGCEAGYLKLRGLGVSAEWARTVLPIGLKTEVFTTYDITAWRHFLAIRAVGTTGRPHPQMRQVAVPLLRVFQYYLPVLFDDLVAEFKPAPGDDEVPWAAVHVDGRIHRLGSVVGGLAPALLMITDDPDPPYIPTELTEEA